MEEEETPVKTPAYKRSVLRTHSNMRDQSFEAAIKPFEASSKPKVEEAPAISRTKPRVAGAPSIGPTKPRVVEAPAIAPTKPKVSGAPAIKRTKPKVSKIAPNKPIVKPVNKEAFFFGSVLFNEN